MSKSKKDDTPSIPTFANSVFKIGDTDIARTYKDASGQIINQYYETDDQKALNAYYAEALAEYLPKVNSFSPDYITSRNAQLDAYKKQGTDYIDEIYTPMLDDLKNDTVSRFGTLNSSSFIDRLNDIENQRGKAVESLAETLLTKQDELDNQELARNYSFIDLLLNRQDSYTSNVYNALGLTSTSSNLLNDFNLANQGNYYKNYLLGNSASSDDSNLPYIFR